MATVGLRTCRSWTRTDNVLFTCSRSYAAMAIKNKQKSSASQTLPVSSQDASPSSNVDSQPSNSKAKKLKSRPLSVAEENVQVLENIKRFVKVHNEADIWGMEMTSLDAVIPYDLGLMLRSLTAKPIFASSKFSDLWYAIKHNTSNCMKNSYSMFVMARANAFPGKNIKLGVRVLGRILSVRDNSPEALLAPLRQIALTTYRKVNTSIARGREDMVKEFTSGPFQEKTITGMRRREKGQTWSWSITSDVADAVLFPRSRRQRVPTPVDIVSIRACEVYGESQDPVHGHRLVIQALVKFDTTQKIDVFDKHGRAVKSDPAGSRKVVQYLLLEKVGWYDAPWKIREQFYKV